MPIYQYICQLGHKSEGYHSIDNRLPVSCPKCGGPCSIVITAPSIRVAKPCSVYTHDGKLVKWWPDGGSSPPEGEPYPIGG